VAPDLTVSIVNASRRDTLLPLLASLEGEDAELVVLDNASDDGSVEAVRERFPGVRVIEQPFRAGFGANHNRVIRETESRYVLLLSHDAEPEPGALRTLVAFADAQPRAAAVAPRLRYPDGSVQANAWRFPTPAVAALGTLTLARVGVVQSRGEAPRRVNWAMGAALLLRRAALDDARRHIAKLDRPAQTAFRPLGLVEPYLAALETSGRDPLREIADINPLYRLWRLARWRG